MSKKRKRSFEIDVSNEGLINNFKKKTKLFSKNRTHQIKHLNSVLENLFEKKEKCCAMNIVEFKFIEREIKKTNEKLLYFENKIDETQFAEQMMSIIKNPNDNNSKLIKKQKAAIFQNIFDKENAIPCYIDSDICSICNKELIISFEESINICPYCAKINKIIFNQSDFIQNEHNNGTTYKTKLFYKKYLLQFWEGTKNPPNKHIEKIWDKMSNTHFPIAEVIKPTPMCKTFKKCGLNKLVNFKFRVTKFITNEVIVKFSLDLINILVERFVIIFDNFLIIKKTLSHPRKKTLNFELLTHNFLLMEGKYEMSKHFHLHKTRKALTEAIDMFDKCCDLITDSKFNWKITRVC
jgi:hypothetical protein